MKIYLRLLLLAVFSVPMLSGCGGSSSHDDPDPAAFGAATFDNSTWN